MRLLDEPARHAIRTELDETLVVEAAAGTGKTTALVGRIMALLVGGKARLATLVAVTFTEKAAGEMKLRLRGEIEKARVSVVPAVGDVHRPPTPEEQERLEQALQELEAAHIGTIHGFCADILRAHPVEARVDPLFETTDEEAQERIYDQVFERWFARVLDDPPEGVRRLLRRQPGDGQGLPARRALHRAGLDLVKQRDFDAPFARPVLDRDASIDTLLHDLAVLGETARRADRANNAFVQGLLNIGRFAKEIERRERARPRRDYDAIEQQLRGLARKEKWWSGKGGPRFLAKDLAREQVAASRDALRVELDRFVELADADLAACLQRDLLPLVGDYRKALAETKRLDFLDLLVMTRDLLRDDASTRHRLRDQFTHILVDEFQDTDPLQAEILLLLAAADANETDHLAVKPVPGKLFVVGDPKQSIYRFRRADVTLYSTIKAQLVAHGAKALHLSTSFRATPAIQRAINAAFAPGVSASVAAANPVAPGSEPSTRAIVASPDGSQPDYVPLQAYRDDPSERPSVVALPVPRPYGSWGRVTNQAIDESLPDAMAAFVDWLIASSGWTIDEGDGRGQVRIEARHVCILFRRFVGFAGSDVTRAYARALEARGIAHVLVGGRSFYAREEVLALRNALAAIEHPDDELSVFATLHGPFFAFSDDELMAYRARHRSLHPMRSAAADGAAAVDRAAAPGAPAVPPAEEPPSDPVAGALALLRELHLGRNRRPFADTVVRLLDATRAHAGVAIWPAGEQALANLLRIVDQARKFEAAGGISFRAFLRRLDGLAERGAAAEAPVVEEGTDGVRIMTVHKAKGLEFPVVILADPTCPMSHREPSRFVDARRNLWAMPLAGCSPLELIDNRETTLRHDAEEAVRLAYVATTRAREILVVPVVGDEAKPGWVDVMFPALYPPPDARRKLSPAPGCPAFGDDSVLDRPFEAQRDAEGAVAPGMHRAQRGEHQVVFWDPALLASVDEPEGGLRQQWILTADETGASVARGESEHAAWQTRRAALLQRGSAPSMRVRTPTEIGERVARAKGEAAATAAAPRQPSEAAGVARGGGGGAGEGAGGGTAVEHLEVSARRPDRPRGKRFGTLVHAILALVPWHTTESEILALAAVEGRLMGANQREVESAAQAVAAALAHPLLERARSAVGGCRRECPVAYLDDDGILVEGIVDLAFREADGGWTVVDFKTDAEMTARAPAYEAQVLAYVTAIARATGAPARGVLLSV